MANKKIRKTSRRQSDAQREHLAFPILLVLVMSVIVFGMFQYLGLLVLGSVVFVGFFGWRWWSRRAPAAAAAHKGNSKRRRKRPSR